MHSDSQKRLRQLYKYFQISDTLVYGVSIPCSVFSISVIYLVLAYVHIYPRKVKLLTSFTQNLVPGSIAEVEKINQGYKELLDSNLPLSGSN